MMSPYVTLHALSFGTMCRGMKKIVSSPFACPGIPCTRHLSSFPYEWVHVALVLGLAMRFQYSKSLPCLQITEFAISQSHGIGSFWLAIFAAVILKFGLVMLMHELEEEVPTSSASWSGTLTSLLNTPLRSRLRLP